MVLGSYIAQIKSLTSCTSSFWNGSVRLLNLDQGNPEWHIWRSGGIGASDATIIMGLSPWFTREQLLRRKVSEFRERSSGVKRSKPPSGQQADNGAMARGHRLEPLARDLYSSLTGIRVRPVCVIHDELEWHRASLDGLSEDNQIPLEIKCVNIQDHMAAVEGCVPTKYVPQVQHQLFTTGLPELHYWSYSDNRSLAPRQKAVLVPVKPCLEYQQKLLVEEAKFWHELQAKVGKG
jgi:putative phage-type endonuclease